jgi:trehalose synthase
VLLHDPQTAGRAAPLAQAGARVVWRCHIGVDWENDATRAGWEFLRPHLAAAEAYVFSRREYVPPWIPAEKVWIIPPSIDPFSPKNQDLDSDTVRAILARLGVLDGQVSAVPARFVRRDGDVDTVTRPAVVIGDGRPGPDDPVLLQVSRWDRLKDMAGVMRGFADYAVPGCSARWSARSNAEESRQATTGISRCTGKTALRVPAAVARPGLCARTRISLVTLPHPDPDSWRPGRRQPADGARGRRRCSSGYAPKRFSPGCMRSQARRGAGWTS